MRIPRKLKRKKQDLVNRRNEILKRLEKTSNKVEEMKEIIRWETLTEEQLENYSRKLRKYKQLYNEVCGEREQIEEEENDLMEEIRIQQENYRNTQIRYPNSTLICDSDDELTDE